jgi:hypothetical protein
MLRCIRGTHKTPIELPQYGQSAEVRSYYCIKFQARMANRGMKPNAGLPLPDQQPQTQLQTKQVTAADVKSAASLGLALTQELDRCL